MRNASERKSREKWFSSSLRFFWQVKRVAAISWVSVIWRMWFCTTRKWSEYRAPRAACSWRRTVCLFTRRTSSPIHDIWDRCPLAMMHPKSKWILGSCWSESRTSSFLSYLQLNGDILCAAGLCPPLSFHGLKEVTGLSSFNSKAILKEEEGEMANERDLNWKPHGE